MRKAPMSESDTVQMYNDCSGCGNSGNNLSLVEDVEGKIGAWFTPGMIFLVCGKCKRLTQPENWNEFNTESDTAV